MTIYATVVGRLGRDPEIKEYNGSLILQMAVATDHGYGDRKITMWIDASLWGKRGETLSQYLSKGSQVVLAGQLYTDQYQGRDNETKTALRMRVDDISLVGGKVESSSAPTPRSATQRQQPQHGSMDDDPIPF